MHPIITLTTDFGLAESYVAVMKGVILNINPEAILVDICHTIKPQNIAQAAFILSTTYQFFPEKTVHLAVVDPGVGTERRGIILKTPTACFVAPDNGILSYVLDEHSTKPKKERTKGVRLTDNPQQKELPAGLEAVALNQPRFWRAPVSPTFHGRDVFAPVAAWLSHGLALQEFGEPIPSLTTLPIPRPYREADGSLTGHIQHVDSFGNLITDIKSDDLSTVRKVTTVAVGYRLIQGLSRTYAEGEELLTLIGSNGYLEVSLRGGSAASLLKVSLGDKVKVKF